MVLVSLGPCSTASRLLPVLHATLAEARHVGSTLVWIRPPDANAGTKALRIVLRAARIPSFHSEAIHVHMSANGKPSARGYAGWAGALWRWIG